MYAEPIRSFIEVKKVLNSLCDKTVEELEKTLGSDWKRKTFQIIRAIKKERFIIKLKKNNKPVGLFGLIPLKENVGGIFLLTTDDLYEGNLITFIKSAREKVDSWCNEYDLIMDSLFKENQKIKKWLILLKFEQSSFEDKNFQIWYRGNIELFKG